MAKTGTLTARVAWAFVLVAMLAAISSTGAFTQDAYADKAHAEIMQQVHDVTVCSDVDGELDDGEDLDWEGADDEAGNDCDDEAEDDEFGYDDADDDELDYDDADYDDEFDYDDADDEGELDYDDELDYDEADGDDTDEGYDADDELGYDDDEEDELDYDDADDADDDDADHADDEEYADDDDADDEEYADDDDVSFGDEEDDDDEDMYDDDGEPVEGDVDFGFCTDGELGNSDQDGVYVTYLDADSCDADGRAVLFEGPEPTCIGATLSESDEYIAMPKGAVAASNEVEPSAAPAVDQLASEPTPIVEPSEPASAPAYGPVEPTWNYAWYGSADSDAVWVQDQVEVTGADELDSVADDQADSVAPNAFEAWKERVRAKAAQFVFTVRLPELAMGDVTVRGMETSAAGGAVSFTNTSKNLVAKSFAVGQDGTVTVPQGTPSGSYVVTVQATFADGLQDGSVSKAVAFVVRVA